MSEAAQTRIFGIRHHGPGCARSLISALETWEPDCLLVEGPPDGEPMLPFVIDADMVPPVALLIHAEDEAQRVAFYPFAEFSPEWQALRYGLERKIPVRFMDLPIAVQFALDREREDRAREEREQEEACRAAPDSPDEPSAESSAVSSGELLAVAPQDGTASVDNNANGEEQSGEAEDFDYADPLDWLGRAAGYESGESWWNHMVEERADGLELFDAIREAMAALRKEGPGRKRSSEAEREEALREAHMRKCLRQARKEGFLRIAVVCGAWHVSALEDMPPAKADNALLKNLPKIKVAATWAPWTYANLSRSGGYGAGVLSPAWYEHLWRSRDAESRSAGWLANAARLFRQEDIDCSPAHIIEAARLANTLAALRSRPQPGLPELYEALQTVVCMGDPLPLRLIAKRLITGEKMGRVPEGVPAIPLQRDMERQQKKLRLKPEASQKTLDLDLRKTTDLERSRLLHRLRVLDIPWGTPARGGQSKGTFHELWTLEWEPRLLVSVINAGRWGNTVEEAASVRVPELAEQADLPELARLVDTALSANLPGALQGLIRALEDLAAVTTDAVQLLRAVPELVRVARYGDVRGTDAAMVLTVLRGMVPRAAVGLHTACSGLNEESSAALREPIQEAHMAIRLIDGEELGDMWRQALRRIMPAESGVHAVLRGLAARLLFDEQALSSDELAALMSLALSASVPPAEAASWLEAFLNRSALVLLHDDALWGLVDAWLAELSDAHFIHVLPMLRRTFTAFSALERRQIAERARRAASRNGNARSAASLSGEAWNEERAALPVPFLRRLLGLEQA